MIDKFTFYRNYYEIIKYLPEKERIIMYDTILRYMFDNEETELNGLLKGIWINLKMPLDTNKKNIKNGQSGGRPNKEENPTETQTETQTKTQLKPNDKPKPKENNIFNFLYFISNNNYKYIYNNSLLYKKIEEWLKYKQERKEIYKQIGLRSLLTQIDNNAELYGEETIANLITECMANNYKGIIFDKLKNKTNYKQEKQLPNWFGKEIEKEKISDEAERLYQEVFGND